MKRDFHGFLRVKEGRCEPWRFVVSGFDATSTGAAGMCTVVKIDGSKEWVPIDANDRILVHGRRYGRSSWIH